MATYPVKFRRVLCCELQLAYDNFIGRHLVIPHVSQDLCEVRVIQLPHSGSNEGAVDILVGSYSRPLETTNAPVKIVYLPTSPGLLEGKGMQALLAQGAQLSLQNLCSSFYSASTALPVSPLLCQRRCRTGHVSWHLL